MGSNADLRKHQELALVDAYIHLGFLPVVNQALVTSADSRYLSGRHALYKSRIGKKTMIEICEE